MVRPGMNDAVDLCDNLLKVFHYKEGRTPAQLIKYLLLVENRERGRRQRVQGYF